MGNRLSWCVGGVCGVWWAWLRWVGSPVRDGVDGVGEAVEGVGGDGDFECGLVALAVVGDGEVEGVVEGALQVVWGAGEVELELR